MQGMLAFSSYGSYESLVNDNSDTTYTNWIEQASQLTYNSLLNNRQSDSSLYDAIWSEMFKSILNTDGCFIIKDYMFKVNPFDSTTYILFDPTHSFVATDVADLMEQDTTNNNNVIGMEGHRSGLELLKEFDSERANNSSLHFRDWWNNFRSENPNEFSKSLRCTESGCGERYDIKFFGAFNSFAISAKYERLAVFFNLQGRFSPSGTAGQVKFEVDKCCYKIKCGNQGGGTHTCITGSWVLTYAKYQSYQGSVPLNGFRFKLRGTNTSCGNSMSPFVEISANPPC